MGTNTNDRNPTTTDPRALREILSILATVRALPASREIYTDAMVRNDCGNALAPTLAALKQARDALEGMLAMVESGGVGRLTYGAPLNASEAIAAIDALGGE
jgi:hypothetical protein